MKSFTVRLERTVEAKTAKEAAAIAWAQMRKELWPRLTVVGVDDEYLSEQETRPE